jgi:hypothetical protein
VSGGATLTVQPTALAISTTSLPGGAVNQAYSTTLSAAGGTAPYTWSLAVNSALPPGLSLSANGQITGTPTSGGSTSLPFRSPMGEARSRPPPSNSASRFPPIPPSGVPQCSPPSRMRGRIRLWSWG